MRREGSRGRCTSLLTFEEIRQVISIYSHDASRTREYTIDAGKIRRGGAPSLQAFCPLFIGTRQRSPD
jgi:hypothetical protein